MWVQLAEDHAYKKAHRVVSILPKTLEYMVSRGMRPDKWAYVPNGVNLHEWRVRLALPAETEVALQAVKARGLPVLGYTGTHGLANALDVLLDAATLLKGEVEIVLVGTGPERDRLMRRVAAENVSNVTMLPSVPKAGIPKLLDAIDIAFIGWLQNPLYQFGIAPNKLMDYMMAAKPIVHSVAAGNDPVTELGCGITVPPNDAKAIAVAVTKLLKSNKEEFQQMGRRGKLFVTSERNYAILGKKFLKLLEK
jgi:glycosyltransferase involved in cell wall biosynthesis